MEAHSDVVLHDGSPSRSARGDQCAGISSPDVSLEDALMAHHFSWEAIPELVSDNLSLLLSRDKDNKVERVHARRRPNYNKADWPLFHLCPKQSTRTTPWQLIEEAFTTDEIQQALTQLKADKAAGPDGIAHVLLTQSLSNGSSVLFNIRNSSWLSSRCPQSWHAAYVVPFLKKGRTQQTWEVTAQ